MSKYDLGRRVASLALGVGALLCVPAGQLLTATSAHAASFDVSAAEQRMFQDLNADRAANGLGALAWSPTLGGIARDAQHTTCGLTLHGRSQDMVDRGYMAHQIPPCNVYVSAVMTEFGLAWQNWGENIVWNEDSTPTTAADDGNTWLMNDAPHKANILGNFNQVGIGVVWAGTWTYGGSTYHNVVLFTEDFMTGPLPAPAPPPPPPPPPTLVSWVSSGWTQGGTTTPLITPVTGTVAAPQRAVIGMLAATSGTRPSTRAAGAAGRSTAPQVAARATSVAAVPAPAPVLAPYLKSQRLL